LESVGLFQYPEKLWNLIVSKNGMKMFVGDSASVEKLFKNEYTSRKKHQVKNNNIGAVISFQDAVAITRLGRIFNTTNQDY